MPTKAVQRRILTHQFLERHAPISRELVDRCYDTADAAFREVWYGQNVTWPQWFERVARLLKGKQCAMNSPTTQLACHGTPEEVRRMVTEFIEATTPHTTACVMPGCEIDSYSPVENVRALIDAARTWRQR